MGGRVVRTSTDGKSVYIAGTDEPKDSVPVSVSEKLGIVRVDHAGEISLKCS